MALVCYKGLRRQACLQPVQGHTVWPADGQVPALFPVCSQSRMCPKQLTLLPQVRLSLLDGGHHHVPRGTGRQPVETSTKADN